MFISLIVLIIIAISMIAWYQREDVIETDATVHLQSEHEHFHFHVDLPPHLTIQPGDTVHILEVPDLGDGRTDGAMSYQSRVRLHKASWLQRHVTKRVSLVEVNELVDHP